MEVSEEEIGVSERGNFWVLKWKYPKFTVGISKDQHPTKPFLSEIFEEEAEHRERRPQLQRKLYPHCRAKFELSKKDLDDIRFLKSLAADCKKIEKGGVSERDHHASAKIQTKSIDVTGAYFEPRHPERIVYNSEFIAWKCLDLLNRCAYQVFSNYSPCAMRTDNQKSYLEATGYETGIINYCLDSKEADTPGIISHEFAHHLETLQLADKGQETDDGLCTTGAKTFQKEFSRIWNTYANSQMLEFHIERLLQDYNNRR